MISVAFAKLACLSGFFAYAHAQRRDVTYGRPTNGISSPRQVSNWISPEYKWIFGFPLPIPPVKEKKLTWTDPSTGASIDYYEIELKAFEKQIYPELPATSLEGYDGWSPGPTLVMQQGRETVVRFTNNGPTKMSVHVHGQYNRSPFDGWASDYALAGQYKDYYYPNAQNARTIWYHDHTEYQTARNAYRGQEGLYILTDPQEQALGLPSGKYDIPLMLAAKVYNPDGSLQYNDNYRFGLWGDVIEVNGQPWPYLHVEPRKYRFRVLNGAVSRTFQLSLQDEANKTVRFDVIGSDCGLLSAPVETQDLFMAMGERYEIIVDFADFAGKNITLRNARTLSDNPDFPATDKVMRFIVANPVANSTHNCAIPRALREIPPIPSTSPAKDFAFGRGPDGRWLINGIGFSDIENRILTRPVQGADEIWTLRNTGGGGTHPVHIHLVDFQILSRTGGRNSVLPYEAAGRKDIVFLAVGETVQVVARYAPWAGVYMFHCHNLVHEDYDMLTAFNVSQLAQWGYANDTIFINPMEPQFRPKNYRAEDYTEDAIRRKMAWLWSTNPYRWGITRQVYETHDADLGTAEE